MTNTHGDELGRNLRALWSTRGSPSYKSIERALHGRLGAFAPSDETIAKWHKGKVSPETGDLVVAAALAYYYGVPLRDLHPVFAERGHTARDLLIESSAWIDALLVAA